MSAPVSQAHASFEAQCRDCHKPWSKVTNVRCSTCHWADLMLSNHQELDHKCAKCHSEHESREADLKDVSINRCLFCHEDILTEARHPPAAADQCLFCHGQHHPLAHARRLESDLIFPHNVHLASTGIVNAECRLCHRLAAGGIKTALPKAESCLEECHRTDVPLRFKHDTKKEITSKECLFCHDQDRKASLAIMQGMFTLKFSHGDHRAYVCEECHAEQGITTEVTEIAYPDIRNCKKCH